MDSPAAQVRATVIHVVGVNVSAHGKDFLSLLDDVGLRRDLLDDHIGMAPLAPVIALFERAAEILSDPCFGLHLSATVRPGATGLLGKLMISAPTVRIALQVMKEYGHVHMTKVDAGFEERDGRAYVHWALPEEITAPRLQYSSFLSSIIVRRLNEAIGRDWHPLKCEFAHRVFNGHEEAARVFGAKLEFDRPRNEFVIEQDYLDYPMPTANEEMFAVYGDLMQHWEEKLKTDLTPDVIVSVREHIVQVLSSGYLDNQPDLSTIANSIGVTTRVLQRRLDQAGTSFEKVLNTTRSELAEQLLKDTDRPLIEIAFSLGYSDPSVFTRAAKRWFNMSPKEFRQVHRSGDCGQ